MDSKRKEAVVSPSVVKLKREDGRAKVQDKALSVFTLKDLFRTRPDIQSALDRAMDRVRNI